uniref:Uncharacterized protein n=1 Tax=Fagus sylvatica TaxID=28930 RepID=A0A2N9EK02_FAGSY
MLVWLPQLLLGEVFAEGSEIPLSKFSLNSLSSSQLLLSLLPSKPNTQLNPENHKGKGHQDLGWPFPLNQLLERLLVAFKSNECVDRRAKFKVVVWLTLGGGSAGGINKILKTISFGLRSLCNENQPSLPWAIWGL